MSTSGSFNWQRSRNEIIERALRLIGVVAQGDVPSPDQYAEADIALNSMVKSWQAENIHLWNVDWKTQSLTASSEVTGTDSEVYTCIKNHTSASANKPITGAYYTDFWKQPGDTGDPGEEVDEWVTATAYTAIGHIDLTDTQVLGITEAFWRSSSTDTRLYLITREEYFKIVDKGTLGLPSKLYFNLSGDLKPEIFLWPQPDTSTDILHYASISRLEDFDSGSDNPDFDVKWIDALTFNLAYKQTFEYGVGGEKRRDVLVEATILKEIAKDDSNERADLQISPDLRRG